MHPQWARLVRTQVVGRANDAVRSNQPAPPAPTLSSRGDCCTKHQPSIQSKCRCVDVEVTFNKANEIVVQWQGVILGALARTTTLKEATHYDRSMPARLLTTLALATLLLDLPRTSTKNWFCVKRVFKIQYCTKVDTVFLPQMF